MKQLGKALCIYAKKLKGENGMENTIDFMSIFDHDPQFQNLMKRMLENAMAHSFHGIMITKSEPGYPIVYVNLSLAMGCLIFYRHRGNIKRLLEGSEKKISKA